MSLPLPSKALVDSAWEYVRKMKEEWTEEDWADFYHGIGFGLFKISQRHKRTKQPPAIDYQI